MHHCTSIQSIVLRIRDTRFEIIERHTILFHYVVPVFQRNIRVCILTLENVSHEWVIPLIIHVLKFMSEGGHHVQYCKIACTRCSFLVHIFRRYLDIKNVKDSVIETREKKKNRRTLPHFRTNERVFVSTFQLSLSLFNIVTRFVAFSNSSACCISRAMTLLKDCWATSKKSTWGWIFMVGFFRSIVAMREDTIARLKKWSGLNSSSRVALRRYGHASMSWFCRFSPRKVPIAYWAWALFGSMRVCVCVCVCVQLHFGVHVRISTLDTSNVRPRETYAQHHQDDCVSCKTEQD